MSAGRLAPRGSRTERTWSGGFGPVESWSPDEPSPSPELRGLGGQRSAAPGSSPVQVCVCVCVCVIDC